MIVAVDYFSKWIEAEGLSNISEKDVRKFLWQNVLTRYGIPVCIVLDHGRQFNNDPLKAWLAQFKIKIAFSAVCHPQSNGLAEAANKQILNGLKKKLDDKKGLWLQELPSVLWLLRTTIKRSNGHSPYTLVYGTEALIPVEVGSTSLRFSQYNQPQNEQILSEYLDLVEELREDTATRHAAYMQRVARYYNIRVRQRPLAVGDLVLRKSAAVQKAGIHGKLSATWEGPYQIHSQSMAGTYRLMELDGT